MEELERLLTDKPDSAVYRWGSDTGIHLVAGRAVANRFFFFYIDGRRVKAERDLFAQFTLTLQRPDGMGQDWDGLYNALRDLSWKTGDGFILLYDRCDELAARDPDTFARALNVFREAVTARNAAPDIHPPLYVLLRGRQPLPDDLPLLDEA